MKKLVLGMALLASMVALAQIPSQQTNDMVRIEVYFRDTVTNGQNIAYSTLVDDDQRFFQVKYTEDLYIVIRERETVTNQWDDIINVYVGPGWTYEKTTIEPEKYIVPITQGE